MANVNVTSGARPSGTAATTIPVASRKACRRGKPTSTSPTTKTAIPSSRAIRAMTRVIRRSSSCRPLGGSRTACVSRAMRPNCVSMPVAYTTARAVPETTDVPAKTRLGRSSSVSPGRSDGSPDLRAGMASPVSVVLFVRRPNSSTTRASAGMLSPSARTSTSPGTSCWASICCSSPSRRTRAWAGSSC